MHVLLLSCVVDILICKGKTSGTCWSIQSMQLQIGPSIYGHVRVDFISSRLTFNYTLSQPPSSSLPPSLGGSMTLVHLHTDPGSTVTTPVGSPHISPHSTPHGSQEDLHNI